MILSEISPRSSKIELFNNNHFQFMGELSDPEAVMTCRVQNIKQKGYHQCYIDISFFAEKPHEWPFGILATLLQEKTNPDKISAKSERIYFDKEMLEL